MARPQPLTSAPPTATDQRKIAGEKHQDPPGKMVSPGFERCRIGGKLPSRDAFAEDELEERAEQHSPQERESVGRAADSGRDDVTRADAARRHHHTRS